MEVVRARRVGLRGNGRGWVGEGDAGQVSGGIDAAAAGTLASAMVTREEVKVTVGVVDSRAHGG